MSKSLTRSEKKAFKKKMKMIKRENRIYKKRMDILAELYEIGKVIGRSGFGNFHDGVSKETGDSVAIKTVKKEKFSAQELAREFPLEYELIREAQDVSGAIGLVEYFDLHDRYVYIMENANDCIALETFANRYHFDCEDVIGEGGFGKVYKGLSKKTGDPIAIKIVKKEKLSASELALEVPLELELLRKVQAVSGVIGLFDFFDLSDRYVYVMEKPNDCVSLESFIDDHYNKHEKPLTEIVSKNIWKQLVETTIGCHEYKTYHRDIKPENVLFSRSDRKIRLIDFGCGDDLREGPYFPKEFSGTMIYNPPEVVKENAYYAGPQTVYTLGITLFQMVCGVLPFDKEEEICKGKMQMEKSSMFSKLSPKCQHTIANCLRTNPKERTKLKELLSLPWMIEDEEDSTNGSTNDSPNDSTNISNNDSSNDMNMKVEMPSTKKRKYEDDLESGYTSYQHKKFKRRHA